MTQPTPCPHCPDGHTPADRGTQPWSVWITDDEDRDGQPMNLMVARSAGAHVAESDAEWMRARLNNRDRADRAAVLREAADAVERENTGCLVTIVGRPCQPCATRAAVATHLRRMAEEAHS